MPPFSPPSSSGPPPPTRAAFAFILVTVTLDMLALGIMVPVLPKLVIQLEGGDIARAASVTGLFGFAWNAMQFLFSPLIGAASDRFGRRPIVLLSNLGLGLDYVLMALAPNLGWLFVGRVVSGVTAATFSTATAYITDVSLPEKRAAHLGMIGAAFGLGFIVGPAMGGVLGQINLRLPFWVAASLSLANAAYGLFVLPESLSGERRTRVAWSTANPVGSLALLRSRPVVLGLSAVAFFDYVAHESLPSCFVVYTDYRYAWNERQIGLVLALVGVSTAVVQAALIGPVVSRLGDRGALIAGMALGAVGFAFYGAASSGNLFLIGVPFGALWGIANPALQALMTREVPATHQGRLQGAVSSLRGIGGMIGPILFTQTFAAAIRPRAHLPWPGAPYLLAAALLVTCAAVSAHVARTPEPAPRAAS
ncbi:MAG TPA: TCR/Tet family MFS transporter [Polyangiaceae bacterium]|nr:TCR/Tet family MFS transporter [Polyangiaceae bacterium]